MIHIELLMKSGVSRIIMTDLCSGETAETQAMTITEDFFSKDWVCLRDFETKGSIAVRVDDVVFISATPVRMTDYTEPAC